MDVSVGVKKTRICTLRNDKLHSSTDEGPGEVPTQVHGWRRQREGQDNSYMTCLTCSQRRVMVVQEDGCARVIVMRENVRRRDFFV
jgi:hypothetical protein